MFSKIMKPLSFALTFVLIITGLGYLFVPKYANDIDTTLPTEKVSKGIYNEEKNTVDFLVIGDSESYTSVSPMEIFNKYGYTGFVSGVPGMRIQDIYYNLKDIYEVQQPKVVLLECNAVFRYHSGDMKQMQLTAEGWLKRAFPIFENHNRWKNMIQNAVSDEKCYDDKKDPLKGFDYRTRVKPYKGKPWMHSTKKSKAMHKINKTYLEKITSLCKEKGSQLVLYNTPAPKNWNYQKHNAIEKYAEQNGLAYIDMNLKVDEIGIDLSKDSWDNGDHLNFTGCKKTTAYIGNWLHNNCSLEDHRGDNLYDSWNDNWYNYLKATKQMK